MCESHYLPRICVVCRQEVVEVNSTLGGHGEVQHEDARDEGEDDCRLVGTDVGELVHGAGGQDLDAADDGGGQRQDDQHEEKS